MKEVVIPHNLVRRYLKSEVSGEISHKGIEVLCECIATILELSAYYLIKRLSEINYYRQIHHLQPLKRIPETEYIRLSKQVFKHLEELIHGEIGPYNSETILSKADMEVV